MPWKHETDNTAGRREHYLVNTKELRRIEVRNKGEANFLLKMYEQEEWETQDDAEYMLCALRGAN